MSKTKSLVAILMVAGMTLIVGGLATIISGQEAPEESATPIAPERDLIPIPANISGVVTNADGELIGGAIVQIQGTPITTKTDDDGVFEFGGLAGTNPVTISSWTEGHYVGWVTLDPADPEWDGTVDDIRIELNPLPQGDNSEYEWYVFEADDGTKVRGSDGCGVCHREFPEWQADAHSQTATNPRFISMYTGGNIDGEAGQTTKYDAEGVPLPPDPDLPYFGAGFRLDNFNRAGNCATCHTPLASTSPNNINCAWSGCHTDLTIERSNGVIDPVSTPLTRRAQGAISCEFCHKISDVYIDSDTGMPYPDMPGILSLRLNRPRTEKQDVTFGTMIDVQRQDSYLPLLSESEFCAGCHFGVFGGVVGMERVADGTIIYNSYGEWLDSPYSDPETGASCQDCHMPLSSEDWFVFPERGGIERDYQPLHNHTMPGASDSNLLQNSVTMETTATRNGDQLDIQVSITNDKTGHHVPTDAPIRSMILVVEVTDAEGNILDLIEGSVNPDYSGDYAGVAGKTFAKILRDDLTGEAPTAAFWRPVTIIEDSRIPAMASDVTDYAFAVPAGVDATVNVQLLFRRAFYSIMQEKGWNDPDIIMEQETLQVPAN